MYVWRGSKCNFFEKNKATELAIGIRDNEMCGRGKMNPIEEGSEPEKIKEVRVFFLFFIIFCETGLLKCSCVILLADRYSDLSLNFQQ